MATSKHAAIQDTPNFSKVIEEFEEEEVEGKEKERKEEGKLACEETKATRSI